MGRAVCLRCGAWKWGALTTCRGCGHHPDAPRDQGLHLLASDDHADPAQLDRIRLAIEDGQPFEPDPDALAEQIALVEATPTVPVGFALLVVLVPLAGLLLALVLLALLLR